MNPYYYKFVIIIIFGSLPKLNDREEEVNAMFENSELKNALSEL